MGDALRGIGGTCLPANDAREDLARLRHHEAQAVEVGEGIEQILPLKVGDRIGQLATGAQGIDEVLSRLLGALRRDSSGIGWGNHETDSFSDNRECHDTPRISGSVPEDGNPRKSDLRPDRFDRVT